VRSEDHRLLNSETAGDLDKITSSLDCAKQGMGEEGVVDQLVPQELERGRDYRLWSHG